VDGAIQLITCRRGTADPDCCSLTPAYLHLICPCITSTRRFGFANAQALARGQTGTACRGSEHEVTFIWSITSGKCVVMADGQEVHYSTTRSSVFDYSWTMKGNHILKIVAHANPPLSQTPNFRQYDFFVNGQSFFTFPKVFRLGLAPGQVASPTSASSSMIAAERGERRIRTGSSNEITSLEAPHNPDEVRAIVRWGCLLLLSSHSA
jgi:hypothetical protein